MSFQHSETSTLQPTTNLQDNTFLTLQSSLSLQIFKLNANVEGMLKLVDLLGTENDSANLRTTLYVLTSHRRDLLDALYGLKYDRNDLTEATCTMVVRGSEQLKELTSLQFKPHQLSSLQKASHDLLQSFRGFLLAQEASLERQKMVMQGVKPVVSNNSPLSLRDGDDSTTLRQSQAPQPWLPLQELVHELSVEEGRESESRIREIAETVHELAKLFEDFMILLGSQGQMIDSIEVNLFPATSDALQQGSVEANRYHPKASHQMAYLISVLLVVITVVIFVVLF